MNQIVEEATTTALWQSLVQEAENIAHRHLSETLESYLVFTLIRFTSRPELAASFVGLEFLESMQRSGARQIRELRDIGDKCLLFSGLFPHLAKRRRVRPSYFVNVGRSAYHEAHCSHASVDAVLYKELANDFVAMTDVLSTIRSLDQSKPELDALSAYELWETTNSQHALKTVVNRAEHTDQITLIKPDSNNALH